MGELKHFNLNDYIQKYNIEYLIETGTYHGDAVEYALKFKFKKIYSVELLKENYEFSVNRFKNNEKIVLFNNTSRNGLLEILIKYEIGNCIYWLDAHLPNFYNKFFGKNYKEEKDILIPLEEELKVIVANKDVSKDVFIMDDLRIYETGKFQAGNWNDAINAGVGGIDFIYNLLGKTHDIQKIYDDHGYILCTPKIK